MNIIDYIKPELLIVTVVLYFIDSWMKKGQFIKENHVPIFIGIIGIFICGIWIVATSEFHTTQDVAKGVFASITQGTLVAGLSTYAKILIGCKSGTQKKEEQGKQKEEQKDDKTEP